MSKEKTRISLGEKIGYSLGDSSANFVFQLMIIFQLGFYTDVFGIKATVAGTILLVARVIDAFVDPVVGILSDRTNTKWGKYRPWVLWTALPFGVFFWLAFTTPDMGEQAKILNRIILDVYSRRRLQSKRLKELVGHTPVEVMAGCVFGILLAIICS